MANIFLIYVEFFSSMRLFFMKCDYFNISESNLPSAIIDIFTSFLVFFFSTLVKFILKAKKLKK